MKERGTAAAIITSYKLSHPVLYLRKPPISPSIHHISHTHHITPLPPPPKLSTHRQPAPPPYL